MADVIRAFEEFQQARERRGTPYEWDDGTCCLICMKERFRHLAILAGASSEITRNSFLNGTLPPSIWRPRPR